VIRHDALVNGVITLAQCLSWFNPLVHLAAFYARLDQELACDDDVMRRFPDDRRTYAEAMLKSHLATAPAPLGCQWPSRSVHPLEERIAMLSKPRPGKLWRLAGAALVAGLCLATAYVASAREGAQQSAPGAGAASTGLSMRWVDESEGAANRAGNQRVAAPDGDLWREPGAVMTGDMIASAATMTDRDGNVVVGFQLTQEGKGRFVALTRANIGRRLAILVNGTLVSAPVIRSEISEGAGQISGRWETAEAEALAAAIAPKRESR
jgi:hypothetical protein